MKMRTKDVWDSICGRRVFEALPLPNRCLLPSCDSTTSVFKVIEINKIHCLWEIIL